MMTDSPIDFDDEVRYDDRRGTYHVTLDRSRNDTPSVSIVLAIATIEGVDPTDLTPLDHHVDTDALDALFGSGDDRPTSLEGTLSFEYEGYQVTMGEGEIVIDPTAPS